MTNALTAADVVTWTGDLLWPTTIPEGRIIDASTVSILGVWTFAWLHEHPGTAFICATPMRQRLHQAGVPIRWFASIADALHASPAGVTSTERDLLWE